MHSLVDPLPAQSPSRTWPLFLAASALTMSCTAAVPALSLLESGFWRDPDAARLLDVTSSALLGLTLAQPVTLLVRVALVSLVAQLLLLLLGHPIRFSALFRISLIASFAQLAQLVMTFVPVFEFRDLAHAYAVPGSLSIFFPDLAADKVWGGAIRQVTIFEVIWGVVYVKLLRRIVPGGLAIAVPAAVWLISFLVIWLLTVAVMFVGSPT